MIFKIKSRTYYNSCGEVVSQEDFEKEWKKFNEQLEEEYNRKLEILVNSIPENLSKEEKLKTAYLWLVNNIKYEHALNFNVDGSVSTPLIEIYNKWGIRVSDKYAPLLLGKTICSGIAPVVDDICIKLGIESQLIYGETRLLENGARLKHVWNVISIDGKNKHLDITYGIYNKEANMNPLDFFLVDDTYLREIGPHCNYDDAMFANNLKK